MLENPGWIFGQFGLDIAKKFNLTIFPVCDLSPKKSRSVKQRCTPAEHGIKQTIVFTRHCSATVSDRASDRDVRGGIEIEVSQRKFWEARVAGRDFHPTRESR